MIAMANVAPPYPCRPLPLLPRLSLGGSGIQYTIWIHEYEHHRIGRCR